MVIVESPAKAKTIERYLGPGYKVKASMGHVRDLPPHDMGIDLERSWVIGDRPEDMQLARRAGCACVYVLTGHGANRRDELEPDVVMADDFLGAAQHVLAHSAKRSSATEPR